MTTPRSRCAPATLCRRMRRFLGTRCALTHSHSRTPYPRVWTLNILPVHEQVPRQPLSASTNAVVKATGGTPKKAAPAAPPAAPPPPPPPPPPAGFSGVPSVRDLAGGLAALRKVKGAQQQQGTVPAAPPVASAPAAAAASAPPKGALVVDVDQLAKARAALRKTAPAAKGTPEPKRAPSAGASPLRQPQPALAATPKAKATPTGMGTSSMHRGAAASTPVRGSVRKVAASTPVAAAAARRKPGTSAKKTAAVPVSPPPPAVTRAPSGEFTFAPSPAPVTAAANAAAPAAGMWLPFGASAAVEPSPVMMQAACMTTTVDADMVVDEPEPVPVPDATEMLVDATAAIASPPKAVVAAPTITPLRARRSSARISDVMAAAAAATAHVGVLPDAVTPLTQAPVASPMDVEVSGARGGATDMQEECVAPAAAQAADAAMHAMPDLAMQLQTAHVELRRAKKALRVRARKMKALKRALDAAHAASAASGETSRVVVLRPTGVAAAPPRASVEEGACIAGSVVVIYTRCSAVPEEVTAMPAMVMMQTDEQHNTGSAAPVVAAAAPPPSTSRVVPPWMFRSPPRSKPGNEPNNSPLPEWLFAEAAAAPGAAQGGANSDVGRRLPQEVEQPDAPTEHVTPRSATRRKSMAARVAWGADAPVADGGLQEEECDVLPLVLAFAAEEEEDVAANMDGAVAEAVPVPAVLEEVEAAAHVVEEDIQADKAPVAAPEIIAPARLDAASGAALVGARVVVWWPMDAAWYAGKVAAFSMRTKKHTVAYDDGAKEAVSLAAELVRDEAAHVAALEAGLPLAPVMAEAEEEEPSKKACAAKKAPAAKRTRAASGPAIEVEAPAPKRVTRSRRA